MLLVKITIMDIQYKALLQLMKITFEKSENDDLNLIIYSSSSSDEEETVRNIKKIIKLIL